LAADHLRGGLWIGFYGGGISYFADGHIQETYSARDGLGGGSVSHLQVEKDGTLWAATESGLSRMKNGRFATLARQNGLPCDQIHWVIQDGDHSFWLYTACGLVRLTRSEIDNWTAASDGNQAQRQMVHPTVFDSTDGAPLQRISYHAYNAPVTKSMDGKIWFVTLDGLSVLDPRHLPFNGLPPPVHIEGITADANSYSASNGLRLPPLPRALTISYTALSLAAPEKVRFRYQLEGQDPDWREVVNERQVRYTNLAPGHYIFRVIACNNYGVWNEAGAFLDFSIAPAFYQTTWFHASCAAALLLILWAAYQYRVHQLERQFAIGLEARVNERTRIARDLHDTLLQSFNALLLRLQTVSNALPARPDEARQRIDRAIEQASSAITEGRDALFELRSSRSTAIDLDRAISDFATELLSASTSEPAPEFHLRVEGTPISLNPIVRDEVYRIVTEAIRNAVRHANASRIEVEIRYDGHRLRLRIGDDGTGISPAVLEFGHKSRHWGLRGMRERAKVVGGTLEVWSQVNGGTEIELSIPAACVYAKSSTLQRSFLSRNRNG
jgi:signal transduction histidine kinase